MERNSKSTMEIFGELYPAPVLAENPLKCIEAIGWLRCAKQYIPTLEDWFESTIDALIETLAIYLADKEGIIK